MRILAIGAHPDDIEISCAGSLIKMSEAGHEVFLCHCSDGDKGHYEISADELIRIRKREAEEAGTIIGGKVLSLGMKDGEILEGAREMRQAFIDLLRSVEPDMVITHAPNDYMPDHAAVSRLVFDTSFLATLPGFGGKQAKKVPALFYMDNLAGVDFQPTLYVDIGDTFLRKMEALGKHRSQLAWLKEHDGIDLPDFVTTLNKLRGMQAGCAYGEGFIQHMVWTRPNSLRFPV